MGNYELFLKKTNKKALELDYRKEKDRASNILATVLVVVLIKN
jgi:hypothetical protein